MVGSMTVINSSSLNGLLAVRLRLVLVLLLAMAEKAPIMKAKAVVNIVILLLPHSHYTTRNLNQNSLIFER